uniref:T-box-containing protein 2-like n=1 Tax=Styela clava TaxID=7725 RepID=UPI00193A4B28|nr:T-box-containing protein 2-like [Styela clava]
MSAFPMPDVSSPWGYHPGATSTSVSGYPGSNATLPMHFNGYSYMGATPLTQQPRRHFPNATPVLGNYIGNPTENDLSLDPYVSKFSPTTQWQMTGKTYTGDNDHYSPQDNIDNNKNFYDSPVNNGQLMELPDPKMQVQLCDRELWDQFSKAGTEMIVTKTGRRMFPGYRIKLSGLDRDAKYCVMMDIVNVDDHRYKFQHGEWTIAGRGEPHLPQRFFLHPDSPATGAKWMSEIVSFHKVKLTNSVGRDVDGKIVLNSMHRYQPRIHIVRTNDPTRVHMQRLCTFAFPQTVFITVTAYQNPEVTKLKIDNNPFAKGFREDGARAKKPRTSQNQFNNEFHQATPYAESKRPAYEMHYRQTPLQHTPVMGNPISRLGFDNGASPELNKLRSHNNGFSQYSGTSFSEDYNSNAHTSYGQSVSNSTFPDYWKTLKSDQNCYGSSELYSQPGQNMQMNQNHHTTVILANNLSISQGTPGAQGASSLPHFSLSPDNNTIYKSSTQHTDLRTGSPQNFDDILEESVHSITPCQSKGQDKVTRSSDSGIGSSPSTMSDDDNSQAPTIAMNNSVHSEARDIGEMPKARTEITEEHDSNKSFEDLLTQSPQNIQNLQVVNPLTEENLLTNDSSNDSASTHHDNSFPTTAYVPESQQSQFGNPEAIFAFSQDTFHRAFTSESNGTDDAINWETGLVKM